MNDKDFIRQLEEHQRELSQLIHRRLPVLIGRMAKDHFQNNFRLQGFLNNGLTRWPETRRQQSGGKSAASQYGPLLSCHNHLFASIKYTGRCQRHHCQRRALCAAPQLGRLHASYRHRQDEKVCMGDVLQGGGHQACQIGQN